MKFVRICVFCTAFLMVLSLQGWSQSSPAEAFENVTIHTADGQTIENGKIVWRNGIITSVGENISIPFDAYIRDGGDSLHVYPGFIDGLSHWGSPKVEENLKTPDEPGNPTYERAGIQPQRHPADHFEWDKKVLAKAPKHGFTTAALALKGQMLPGQVDLFFINGEQTKDYELQSGIGVFAQFKEAQGSTYPSTTMGLMSRFRQLFHDANALKEQQYYFASTSDNYPAPEQDKVLEALYPVIENEQPFYFVVDTKENIERLFSLQDELGFNAIIVSGKEAYRKADELKRRNIPVLASIDLPEEPEWRTADGEESESEEKIKEVTEEMRLFRERQLQAYKADIENISKLIDAGVKVGFATNGLKISDIKKNLKTLNEAGMSEDRILRMLTQSTAEILGYGQKMGDLRQGHIASFTVFSEPFMDEEAKAVYSVTDGDFTEFEQESSNN